MNALTINPQNWVTDEAEILIDGDTVKINGETLTLKEGLPYFDGDRTKYDFRQIHVEWDGIPGENFCTLIRFGDDRDWACSRSGIAREHANPFILAAMMAANLI